MYRIIRGDGMELGITDSILFIKIAENGCFVPSREEDAIGVAFRSVAYNLIGHNEIEGAETVVVSKIDGGDEMFTHQAAINEMIHALLEG